MQSMTVDAAMYINQPISSESPVACLLLAAIICLCCGACQTVRNLSLNINRNQMAAFAASCICDIQALLHRLNHSDCLTNPDGTAQGYRWRIRVITAPLLIVAMIMLATVSAVEASAPLVDEELPATAHNEDTPLTSTASDPLSPPDDPALQQRLEQEQSAKKLQFSILPHKTNYLLPVTYNTSPNNAVYAKPGSTQNELEHLEVKFQLSIKTPLWEDIFGDNGTLYAAYSQVAFWQAYNSKISSPFREINFEPELFLSFRTNYQLAGFTGTLANIGFNHQSNGRSKPLSRSWNRIVANIILNRDDTYIALKPWFRIPERRSDDDNPSMEKYYGYGELQIIQQMKAHTFTLMLRNNLRASGNKGAFQIDWSFPLHKKLKGYVQYFNGYGESLVDYNHKNNRLGIGIMLTDWM